MCINIVCSSLRGAPKAIHFTIMQQRIFSIWQLLNNEVTNGRMVDPHIITPFPRLNITTQAGTGATKEEAIR